MADQAAPANKKQPGKARRIATKLAQVAGESIYLRSPILGQAFEMTQMFRRPEAGEDGKQPSRLGNALSLIRQSAVQNSTLLRKFEMFMDNFDTFREDEQKENQEQKKEKDEAKKEEGDGVKKGTTEVSGGPSITEYLDNKENPYYLMMESSNKHLERIVELLAEQRALLTRSLQIDMEDRERQRSISDLGAVSREPDALTQIRTPMTMPPSITEGLGPTPQQQNQEEDEEDSWIGEIFDEIFDFLKKNKAKIAIKNWVGRTFSGIWSVIKNLGKGIMSRGRAPGGRPSGRPAPSPRPSTPPTAPSTPETPRGNSPRVGAPPRGAPPPGAPPVETPPARPGAPGAGAAAPESWMTKLFPWAGRFIAFANGIATAWAASQILGGGAEIPGSDDRDQYMEDRNAMMAEAEKKAQEGDYQGAADLVKGFEEKYPGSFGPGGLIASPMEPEYWEEREQERRESQMEPTTVRYGDTNALINRMIKEYTTDAEGFALSPDTVRNKLSMDAERIMTSPAVARTQSNVNVISRPSVPLSYGPMGGGSAPVIVNNQGGPTSVNNGGNITNIITGGSSLTLPQLAFNLPSVMN
jgi:hypothetical protein